VTVGCTALLFTSALIWVEQCGVDFTAAGFTSTSLRGGVWVIGGNRNMRDHAARLEHRNDLKRHRRRSDRTPDRHS